MEFASTKSTIDIEELGEMNPNIRSIVAYNTDSKIINTVRSNGVLLAQITPQGGMIPGSSSVVQLDAWNWQDAAYAMDNGIHFKMPALINRPAAFQRRGANADPVAADPCGCAGNARNGEGPAASACCNGRSRCCRWEEDAHAVHR